MNARTIRCTSVLSFVLAATLFGGFSTGCTQTIDDGAASAESPAIEARPSAGAAYYGQTHGAHGQPLGFRMVLPTNSELRNIGGGTTVVGGGVALSDGGTAARPSWTFGTSLNTARTAHRSVVLPSGKIVVIGGASSSTLLASAEIYDPALGTTTPTAQAMAGTRASHTATYLSGSGRVLVTGGWDAAGGTRDSCELYDPATDTWSPAASMNNSRAEHEAVVLQDGRVLVIGGAINGAALGSAEIFNPTTGTWAQAAPLNVARGYFTASLLANGTVLVVGGWTNVTGVDVWRSAEIYDPLVNTWTNTASLTDGRDSHAAVVLSDGTVVVAGGEYWAPIASAERYTVASRTAGSWSGAGTMPSSHVYLSLNVLPDGRLLAAGGYSDRITITASAEIFDGASWTSVPNLNSARSFMSAHTLGTGQVVLIGGDTAAGTSTATTELFSP